MGGIIPDELFDVTTLREFEIPRAKFIGRLESMSDRFLKLASLQDLDLAYNDFTGPLPDIFWELEKLGTLFAFVKFFVFVCSAPNAPCVFFRGAQTAGQPSHWRNI